MKPKIIIASNAQKALDADIKWCRTKKAREAPLSKEWKLGFVDGLKQAKVLMRKVSASQ